MAESNHMAETFTHEQIEELRHWLKGFKAMPKISHKQVDTLCDMARRSIAPKQ